MTGFGQFLPGKKRLRHWLERSAMDRARAEFMELQKIRFCSVTFVLAETILRELRAKVTHDPVTGDLRDHACRGDLKLMQSPSIIAVCGSGKGITGKPLIKTWSGGSSNASIARRIARWLARRMLIRSISIESTMPTVDLIPDSKSVRNRFLPVIPRELFGIVQTTMPKFSGKNRRCGNDRPR